jgi:Flp pilus assembly protein TadB
MEDQPSTLSFFLFFRSVDVSQCSLLCWATQSAYHMRVVLFCVVFCGCFVMLWYINIYFFFVFFFVFFLFFFFL